MELVNIKVDFDRNICYNGRIPRITRSFKGYCFQPTISADRIRHFQMPFSGRLHFTVANSKATINRDSSLVPCQTFAKNICSSCRARIRHSLKTLSFFLSKYLFILLEICTLSKSIKYLCAISQKEKIFQENNCFQSRKILTKSRFLVSFRVYLYSA